MKQYCACKQAPTPKGYCPKQLWGAWACILAPQSHSFGPTQIGFLAPKDPRSGCHFTFSKNCLLPHKH